MYATLMVKVIDIELIGGEKEIGSQIRRSKNRLVQNPIESFIVN